MGESERSNDLQKWIVEGYRRIAQTWSECKRSNDSAETLESGENGDPALRHYEDHSDTEVALLAQRGHEDAAEELLFRYRDLVHNRVQSHFLRGTNRDDLLQIGTIGLYMAILKFKPADDTSFPALARDCIDRHLISALKGVPP